MTSVLISPTAYKGTLTPFQAARLLQQEIKKQHPHWVTHVLPLADGGDGTLEVLLGVLKGESLITKVEGPLGGSVRAKWGLVPKSSFFRGKTALIEMARASGLALTHGKNKIMQATSFGTGELIRAALNRGCKNILIGVGGTATAEGGAGALQALGLQYFDRRGKKLSARPVDLLRLHEIDSSGFDRRIFKTKIFVLCDVRNPLLGSNGSAKTFGPQKGATPAQVRQLEKILKRLSQLAPTKAARWPGAGAAGALAFGLAGFAGARLVEGTPFIMKVLRWKRAATQSDWIFTGEGRLDPTSFSGKVIGGILKNKGRARVAAIFGSTPFTSTELRRRGIAHATSMGKAGLRSPVPVFRKAARYLISTLEASHPL